MKKREEKKEERKEEEKKEEREEESSCEESEEESSYEESEEENIRIETLIEKIRKKDPEIYNKETVFYTEKDKKKADKKEESSYQLKDYYRDQTLEGMRKSKSIEKKLAYNREQKESIAEFVEAMEQINPQDELFMKKEKSENKNKNKEDITDDEFLRKYIFGGGWKEKIEEEKKPLQKEFLEEDNKELEMADLFEQSRPSSLFVNAEKPSYANKRKEVEKKERKKQKEAQKEQELKQKKNLKKKQFAEKLDLLRNISGLSKRKISKINLIDDYNEEAFDQLISSIFDKNYFSKEENERPEISDSLAETQELSGIENPDKKNEIDSDSSKKQKIKEVIQEIKQIEEEYSALKVIGNFEYVNIPAVNIPLSVKEIFNTDDAVLKKNFPLDKYAFF